MRIKNPLIGADIEVFLMHRETKELVSAEGYINGTKHEPFNFDPADKYFATSLDNVASEFCIPPVTDKEKFFQYIMKSLNYINETIPEYLCTAPLAAGVFDSKYLQTYNAQTFGCEPDFNVWTRSINPKPGAYINETGDLVEINPNLRSCGGHIHIGYDDPTMEVNELIIKAMDLCVGVPSVLQEPESMRKKLYGKAGAFRAKEYGAEYRTISNYYAGNKRLTEWLFDATMNAVKLVNEGFDFDAYGEDIVRAINDNDTTVAQKLIHSLELEMA